ncbi:aldehyde dehydrogenase family protein, partial [Sinomonas susongensis]
MTIKTIPHFLNGEETHGVGERTQPVFNPATGAQSGELRLADAADLETAVGHAKKASESWGDASLSR